MPIQNSHMHNGTTIANERLVGIKRGLAAEGRAWWVALRDPVLYLLLGLLALGQLLAPSLPFRYVIDVGHEEGYRNDRPFLYDFNTPERNDLGSYRWTAQDSALLLPGVGQRPYVVQFDFMPLPAQIIALAPATMEIWSGDTQLATLPSLPNGGSYQLLLPTQANATADLRVKLLMSTFEPTGDRRQLGLPLNRVVVESWSGGFFIPPDWQRLAMWLLAALLAWATLLRILGSDAWGQGWARLLFSGMVVLVLSAAVLDLPRWALGAQPALLTTAWCYGLTLLLRVLLPALASRLRLSLDGRTLAWLLLIVVLAFGMRYGGRIYPHSMPGDIGFHNNRFEEMVYGRIYLLSRNRGVDFPYPPGPYLAVAPFTLLQIKPPDLLPLGAALMDGLSAVLVYTLVVVGLPSAGRHTALLAAAIYVFTAAGFMTTWWSFSTHIYTQFFALLLMTTVLVTLRNWREELATAQGAWRPTLASLLCIAVVMALVFLGHFGFFINTVLLSGLLVVLVWLAAWRGVGWARALGWPLTLSCGGALLFALLFFYSGYLPLFIAQAQATAEGGLTGLAQRAPADRGRLWQVLWNAGLITHFGFFPVPLALAGVARLLHRVWQQRQTLMHKVPPPALGLTALMAGSFLISICFAVLPFITLSTQSTRWLMFSAWAIAVGTALALRWLWQRGRSGRIAVLVMAGFVLWNTAVVWLGPLLWRMRIPEPS